VRRQHPSQAVLLAAALFVPAAAVWADAPNREPGEETADVLDYRVQVETAYEQLSDEFFWFHPYLAAIPGAGRNGHPAVLMLTQKHLVADDHYSESYLLRTDNLGKSWAGPTPLPTLRWEQEGQLDRAVSGLVPGWHAPSARLLAIGGSCLYDTQGRFVDRPGSNWVYYTTYYPRTDTWSKWIPLGKPADGFHSTSASCCQWIIEPDGTVLLPVSVQNQPRQPWDVMVWRCSFDGKRLRRVAEGNELVRKKSWGLHEPSLTRFQGRYYLTIRSDDSAFVSTSKDGLRFQPIKPWTFDDGADLGSYNTQQHWVTHSRGLFLTYTRRGANNDHVFRHRAPIFIARVDPKKLVVLRDTERVLLPEHGVPMGNFGAASVTEQETWITVGENMWRYGDRPPTYRGAKGAILLGRIIWTRPNRLQASRSGEK